MKTGVIGRPIGLAYPIRPMLRKYVGKRMRDVGSVAEKGESNDGYMNVFGG